MNMISDLHIDALTEMVNIGIGRAASSLSDMVGRHVLLEVPSLRVVEVQQLRECLRLPGDNVAAVEQGFDGAFTGLAALMISQESVRSLVGLLIDDGSGAIDEVELDAERVPVLTEVGNILINGLMGSLGNVLGQSVEYKLPVFKEGTIGEVSGGWQRDNAEGAILSEVHFQVADAQVEGWFVLVFEVSSIPTLCERIEELMGG